MSARNSSLGHMLLQMILATNRNSGGPELMGLRLDPMDQSGIREVEEMYLATKPFDPLPRECESEMAAAMNELEALPYGELEAVFITALSRRPAGEVCEGCGEVHDRDGLRQMVFLAGDETTLTAMVNRALYKGLIKVRNEKEVAPDFRA